MNILIRHPMSKRLRCRDGSWSHDWRRAQFFDNTAQAVRCCLRERLPAYQVVVKWDSHRQDDVVVAEKVEFRA